MELREFIKCTLEDVANGVRDAHQAITTTGGFVGYAKDQGVAFDVAVTATESGESGRKVGITVWGVGGGTDSKAQNVNTTVSRVKFTVPMYMPRTDADADKRRAAVAPPMGTTY